MGTWLTAGTAGVGTTAGAGCGCAEGAAIWNNAATAGDSEECAGVGAGTGAVGNPTCCGANHVAGADVATTGGGTDDTADAACVDRLPSMAKTRDTGAADAGAGAGAGTGAGALLVVGAAGAGAAAVVVAAACLALNNPLITRMTSLLSSSL